jgi:hypothetical protein
VVTLKKKNYTSCPFSPFLLEEEKKKKKFNCQTKQEYPFRNCIRRAAFDEIQKSFS